MQKGPVTVIPPKPTYMITTQEYLSVVCSIPPGKVLRNSDIEKFFAKLHHYEQAAISHDKLFAIFGNPFEFPIWRVISERGRLQNSFPYCSKENQKLKLEAEGLTICACGASGSSYKVENYKAFLYQIDPEKLVNIEADYMSVLAQMQASNRTQHPSTNE